MREPRTIGELAEALRTGQLTAEAVTERCLTIISTRNPALNAFIEVFADGARAQARDADAEIAAGRSRGPLHGVPVSLKDLIDVAGTRTTAGSRVRRDHVASKDAPLVRRLRNAGAVVIGKNNLHEFALGTTNEDSAFGPARHPLDPTRSPGGSSGGSAAAVAAGMAYASIGTDTGGSVRIPAAVCGLVGLKPSFGDIPADGVVPLSTTLDSVGPLCRSVEDAQILYDLLCGDGPAARPPTRSPRDLRLRLLTGYLTERLDPEVEAVFEAACGRLRDAGVALESTAIGHARHIAAIYLHIVLAEAAAYHGVTLDRCPDDYTASVRRRLEAGRYILAEDYVRALRGRDVLRAEVDAALDGCDGLLLPTLPITAPSIGLEMVRVGGAEEPVRNVMLRLTQLFNITGHPAMTVPCGSTTEELPVGAQLVGRRGSTPELLHLARTLEPYLGPGISR